MNNLQRLVMKSKARKLTENGDIAFKTTGDNLTDLFFMTPYFEKHLDEVHIGQSERDKVFSMYIRDPRFGLGRRDLGRELMLQSNVDTIDVVKAGRIDDLLYIARDEDIKYLKENIDNELVKKWLPRLTSKDKNIAKALCKMWNLTEKEYRKLIKANSTTEFKLSYAEKSDTNELERLFNKNNYVHPLVDEINFEQVPSLAMKKYLRAFSTREDTKERFNQYMQDVKNNKKKINVSTTNVVDAKDVVMTNCYMTQTLKDNQEILGKKIVDNATIGIETDAIVILDTSGSMGSQFNKDSLLYKAMAIAHGISTHSTYAKNQLISFSSRPRLMTIKGNTLKEQYNSMYTGDCSNTDFGAVMRLLRELEKYPKYLIVISDQEFDWGSNQSKEETMRLFKQYGADTKIIWWNLNDRNKTTPELDEYGNFYLSGYNLQLLRLIENDFNMTTYIEKILKEYCKKINKTIDF